MVGVCCIASEKLAVTVIVVLALTSLLGFDWVKVTEGVEESIEKVILSTPVSLPS